MRSATPMLGLELLDRNAGAGAVDESGRVAERGQAAGDDPGDVAARALARDSPKPTRLAVLVPA